MAQQEKTTKMKRIGQEVDLEMGSSGLLSEDLNNPCRESELKRMYDELGRSRWADFICKIRIDPQYKEMKKQAEEHIRVYLQRGQEEIPEIIDKLKNILLPKEQDKNTKTSQYYDAAIQHIQMAVYTKKGQFLVSDVPEYFKPMAEECYKIGCLMALHNPPLYLDFNSSEQRSFPPIKTEPQVLQDLPITTQPEPQRPELDRLPDSSCSGQQTQSKNEADHTSMPGLMQDQNSVLAVKNCTPQTGTTSPVLNILIQFGTDSATFWSFDYFVYDPVKIYSSPIERGGAQTLYYCEQLTAELYNKVLNKDLMIKEKDGKEVRAVTVFSKILKHIKGCILTPTDNDTSGRKYSACDATWVLTVPGEWSSTAKQFMKEAATEAGLGTESDPEKLIVALEPEAALELCTKLPREGFMEGDLEGEERVEVVPRTQYMVVDCGGRSINILVHQVVEGGSLQELHKVSINDMGGQRVDKNFISFLREIFGDELFDEFEGNYASDLQKLMSDFSTRKHTEGDVSVPVPNSLKKTEKKTKHMKDYFKRVSGAEWKSGSILLTGEKMRSLHEDSLRAIEHMVKKTLSEPSLNISYLFLVGGFALSPYVNKLVREKFGSRCKVLCPLDAQMAALKGAFYMMPNVVESRLSLFSYGISVRDRFTESKHRGKSSHVSQDGVRYCDVCFHCLVEKGESVRYGEVRGFSFSPVQRDQTEMRFSLYRTESRSAEFVDEEGMEKIGSVSVPMPDIRRGLNRSVRLEVQFGVTEMKVTATDIDSGQTRSVELDFMSQ